jgi:hypothetical protein
LYDYIILTAAVPRPDLHSRVFPGHLELIGRARVKWLINVDDVDSNHSVAETITHLETLLSTPGIDLECFRSEGAGCFFRAARRLALRAHELLAECRTGVVWLEDDWIRGPRHPAHRMLSRLRLRLAKNRLGGALWICPGNLEEKQHLLERHPWTAPDSLWFVSLVPRSRVSFNPGIWSRALFEHAMWKTLASLPPGRVDDPETLCADPCNEPDVYRRLTVFVDPLYQDGGRRWIAEHGLVKWEKHPASVQKRGSVTYAQRVQRVAAQHPAQANRLGSWVLVRVHRRYTPALLARVLDDNGRLSAHLFAVPFFSLQLQLVNESVAEVYLRRLQAWSRTYPLKKLPGQVVWHRGGHPAGRHIEVDAEALRFRATLTRRVPLRVMWMGPLQALGGLAAYAATLVAALRRLDAE